MRRTPFCLLAAALGAGAVLAASPASAAPGASLPPSISLPTAPIVTSAERRAALKAMYDNGVLILAYTERAAPTDSTVITEVQSTNQWFKACSDWIAQNMPPEALAAFTHIGGATYLYDMNTLHTPETQINNASIRSGMPRYLENLKGLMAQEAGH